MSIYKTQQKIIFILEVMYNYIDTDRYQLTQNLYKIHQLVQSFIQMHLRKADFTLYV